MAAVGMVHPAGRDPTDSWGANVDGYAIQSLDSDPGKQLSDGVLKSSSSGRACPTMP
jgi:hypothetical protein